MLLNLEPDHLDRHGTFEGYRAAKLRIFENRRPATAVVPRGFGAIPGSARRVEFSADDPLPAEPLHSRRAQPRERRRRGRRCARGGRRGRALADALRTFPGVPHRLELVREHDGVRWVNDSIATNTLAVRTASRPSTRRCGDPGRQRRRARTSSRSPRAPENVRSSYLIGEAADELAAALEDAGATNVRRPRRRGPAAAATPSRETSSCSRRPARATTSSGTSRSGARNSGGWWRTYAEWSALRRRVRRLARPDCW